MQQQITRAQGSPKDLAASIKAALSAHPDERSPQAYAVGTSPEAIQKAAELAGAAIPHRIRLDVEEDMNFAVALNDLAHWIGTVRSCMADTQHFADEDAVLANRLTIHGVAFNDGEWGKRETSGLQYLHMHLAARLRSIQRTLGLADEVAQ